MPLAYSMAHVSITIQAPYGTSAICRQWSLGQIRPCPVLPILLFREWTLHPPQDTWVYCISSVDDCLRLHRPHKLVHDRVANSAYFLELNPAQFLATFYNTTPQHIAYKIKTSSGSTVKSTKTSSTLCSVIDSFLGFSAYFWANFAPIQLDVVVSTLFSCPRTTHVPFCGPFTSRLQIFVCCAAIAAEVKPKQRRRGRG